MTQLQGRIAFGQRENKDEAGSRDELTSRMQSEEKQRRMRRKADEAGRDVGLTMQDVVDREVLSLF